MIRKGIPILVIAALTSGCGRDLDTVPCRGVVTFNGQPVEQANVYFLRDGAPKGTPAPAAIAVTDSNGRFELKTGKHQGAMPGKYVVTVQKDNSASLNIPEPLPTGMSRFDYMKAHNLFPRPLLPEKYSRFEQTPLQIEVSADPRKNEFELKLEGTVPVPPKPNSARK